MAGCCAGKRTSAHVAEVADRPELAAAGAIPQTAEQQQADAEPGHEKEPGAEAAAASQQGQTAMPSPGEEQGEQHQPAQRAGSGTAGVTDSSTVSRSRAESADSHELSTSSTPLQASLIAHMLSTEC